MDELHVDDVVALRYGPFAATGTVVEITEAGAKINVHADAKWVGFDHNLVAPNSLTELTDNRHHDFIGRAHWHSTEVVLRP